MISLKYCGTFSFALLNDTQNKLCSLRLFFSLTIFTRLTLNIHIHNMNVYFSFFKRSKQLLLTVHHQNLEKTMRTIFKWVIKRNIYRVDTINFQSLYIGLTNFKTVCERYFDVVSCIFLINKETYCT